MPYELFDPTQPCTSLLPLNPVENKLTFYKVSLFEVSLEDIADIAELPVTYARPRTPNRSRAPMLLGLPIATLFPELREKYQEVRLGNDIDNITPISIGLEGSFLPFNPKRPPRPPLLEHLVSHQEVTNGKMKINGKIIILDKRDQKRLAIEGVALVKVNDRTARLRLDASLPVRVRSAAMMRPLARLGRSENNFGDSDILNIAELAELIRRGIDPQDLTRVVTRGLVHSRPKLPRYDIGLFTAFEQTWTLQGYSRGPILNSLTLGPEEELTIEIFAFDRLKIEEERTLTNEFERNSEVSSMTNITSNIARALSETNQLTGDIELGLSLGAVGIPVDMVVGGSASNEVKADIQASMDRVSEMTSRVSERVKSMRQVKVLEARETGREDRVTRKIRNPNQGYALTLNYYEVHETYKVDTALKNTKQFCLLVEQPNLGAIDVPFVLAYQDRLQRALLSNIYVSGFDAARSLYAQGWFDTASIKVEIEAAANQSIAATASPTQEKPIIVIGRQLADALKKLFDADLLEAAGVLSNFYNPLDGVDVTDREKASAEAALGLVNYAFKLKFVSPGFEDRALTYIAAIRANSTEGEVVEALGSFLAGADDEWLTNLKMLAATIVAAHLASLLLIPFPMLTPVIIGLAVIENNAGYPVLVGKAKQKLKAFETVASLVPPAVGASTSADIKTKAPPPQLFSLQDLSMAHADFDALSLHIEANRVYYMNQIWKAEDPNARFERFRQSGLEAFVENRLIGFIGERAIFPLRLSALDTTVKRVLEQKLTAFDPKSVDTMGSGDSETSVGPIQVGSQSFSLPTSAVYMDGALGQCELLEPYLVQRRDIERRIAQADADLAEIRVADARATLIGSAPLAITTSNT